MASSVASFMRAKIPVPASVDHAILGKIQFAEMAVTVRQFEQHRLLRPGPAAAHFGQPEFKAIGTIDANAVLGPGDRIEDGFAARFHIAGDIDFGAAAVYHQRRFAMAFMDGAWPNEHSRHPQPVELGGTVMALMDFETHHGAAMAMGRQAIELAGTAVRTITIGKF